MTLYEECMLELGDSAYELSDGERKIIEKRFFERVHFTKWGRVDWDKVDDKTDIEDVSIIGKILKDKEYYIIWDIMDRPMVKCKLSVILDKIDNVLPVSFDTFLFSEDERYIVEFYHEGDMTIGAIY